MLLVAAVMPGSRNQTSIKFVRADNWCVSTWTFPRKAIFCGMIRLWIALEEEFVATGLAGAWLASVVRGFVAGSKATG